MATKPIDSELIFDLPSVAQPAVRPDGTVFRRWLRAARPGVTTAR